jgi:hypothetical protein
VDSTDAAFAERMRCYVWCPRLDRTRASTAGLCASSYAAATACFKSVQSLYRASTALPADYAYNTKHNTLTTKHRSKW